MLIRRRVRRTVACFLLSGSILSVGITVFGFRLITACTFAVEYSAFNRGVTLFDKKQFDAAISQFERILAFAPESRVADNALGRIAGSHYWQGHYDKAIAECVLYLSMYPKSNISDNIRTTLDMSMGKFGSTHSDEACVELVKDLTLRYPNLELGFLQFLGLPIDAASKDPEDLPWVYSIYNEEAVAVQDRIRHFLRHLPSNRSAPLALFLMGEHRQLLQQYRGSYLARVGFSAMLEAKYSEIDVDENKPESLQMLLGEIDFALADGHLDSDSLETVRSFRGRIMVRLGLYGGALNELADWLTSTAELSGHIESEAMSLFLGVAVLLLKDAEWESWRRTELGGRLLASYPAIDSFVNIQRLAAKGDYEGAWMHAKDQLKAHLMPVSAVPPVDIGALENTATLLGSRDSDARAFAENVLAHAGEWKAALYRDYPMEVFLAVEDFYYEINNLYLAALEALPKDDDRLLSIRAKLLELLYKSYPVYSEDRRKTREDCNHAYALLATKSSDPPVRRDAMLRRAMIFLDNPWDLQTARECFRSFVNAYPQDSAANNALNWIAWSCCCEANANLGDAGLYVVLYEQAAAVYRELHDRYPTGHLGRNSLRAEAIIRYKIGMVKAGHRKPHQLYRPDEVSIYLADD
ncbi:MAG: hypothetical protein CEE38_12165 [Planctomycetes bacterium B3_Pla]|nr:MAG: hypothetical protein CEE38_12165 [Planctomycetes bacterium B3_Pla]